MRRIPQTRLRPRPYRKTTLLLILILLIAWLAPTSPPLKAASIAMPPPQATSHPPASTKALKLPLAFVPNAGQAAGDVRFQAHAMGGLIAFTPGKIVFSLPAASPLDAQPAPARAGSLADSAPRPGTGTALPPSTTLQLRFEGANPVPQLSAASRLPGVVHYYIGNDPKQWRTNLPTYQGIVYKQLYAGIDLLYDGSDG